MNKPIFNINDYKGKYCMHCDTGEKAARFCDYLDRVGRIWNDGFTYTEHTRWWGDYKQDTVYFFNKGTYGDINHANGKCTILEFDNFDWSMKPRFNIDYFKGKYCMHCDTLAKSKVFCNYLDSMGRTWDNGGDYKKYTKWWGYYKENTVYYFNEGKNNDVDNAKLDHYYVLEFDNFDWSMTQIQNGTITIPDSILSQTNISKDGIVDIHIVNGDLVIRSNKKNLRADWIKHIKDDWIESHSNHFWQMVSESRVKYKVLGKTIIAFFYDNEELVKTQVSGNDVFDLNTGLAIIYAKHNEEVLPDFILD